MRTARPLTLLAVTFTPVLGLALTGMLRDHEIIRDQAAAIARGVLHDNAAKLYGTPGISGNL
jgi:hypothetical protein